MPRYSVLTAMGLFGDLWLLDDEQRDRDRHPEQYYRNQYQYRGGGRNPPD
jgi:hypothetical protein